MQSTVSNNLLNTMLSSKDSQLSAELAENSAQASVTEDENRFELLVAEQINTQVSTNFIDQSDTLQPDLQQGIQQNIAKPAGNLPGNVLPYGNSQAAILGALSHGQVKEATGLQNNAVLPDELVGSRIVSRNAVDELMPTVTNAHLATHLATNLAKSDTDSLLLTGESENRFSRNFLLQHSLQNNTDNVATNFSAAGDKVLNQSFLALMESGAALHKLNTQSNMQQSDVSLKALLSLSSNDGANQPDLIRTDANASYTNSAVAATSKPLLTMTLPPTITSAWQQSFGEKVMWMINQNIQSAEIKLNPPELGRLDIKISMQQQDQTNILFTSQNQQVREIIESALPRLREMLGDSGLNLSDVDVSDKSFTARDNNKDQFSSNDQPDGSDVEASGSDASGSEDIIEQQLFHGQDSARIDYYA